MDFVAIVDQVITLLRQRGRMTYRTLQRQFQLDDEALHDLTDELLYAHPEVRDDAGRGLVWTGDAVTPSAPLPPSSQPAPQPAMPEAALPQTPRPSSVSAIPEAERRQLTSSFVTWLARQRSRRSSTRKTSARWCGRIKTRVPR